MVITAGEVCVKDVRKYPSPNVYGGYGSEKKKKKKRSVTLSFHIQKNQVVQVFYPWIALESHTLNQSEYKQA